MRSSRLWPGSNSMRIAMVLSERTSTRTHVAGFVVVGDRGDRALVALQHLDDRRSAVFGQQRAAPAARTERADRGQRQQRRVDRQDRPLRREIVGGRARRRRHQTPSAISSAIRSSPSTRMRSRAA